jgi:hypothetical protein
MPENDDLIAVHLTAALLQAHPPRAVDLTSVQGITLERAVVRLYFDCLEALKEERAERQEAPTQS